MHLYYYALGLVAFSARRFLIYAHTRGVAQVTNLINTAERSNFAIITMPPSCLCIVRDMQSICRNVDYSLGGVFK